MNEVTVDRKVQDGRASVAMMRDAIRNGTSLPKGHGRLIDADAVAEVLLKYAHSAEGKAFAEFLVSQINDLPSVTPQPKTDTLDKIRAEIEQLRLHKAQFITSDNKVCIDSQEVLNIINKYKAESLEQEPCEDVPDINNGNIYVCSCGYGWDKSKVVRHHFCPNCGAKVAEGNKE